MASAYKRMSAAEQHALFARIVSRCRPRVGEPVPVVVFDLDGTIMDNRPRTVVILQELAAELEREAHSAAERLAAAHTESLAYLLTESLERLGIEHPDLVERAST